MYGVTLTAALFLIVEGIGIAFGIDAVLRRRSSQGAIAWFIGLVALPIAVIPLYLVFGRTRFHGYVEALRGAEAEVGERLSAWHADMEAVAATGDEDLAPVEGVVRALTGIPFTRGNRVTLLIDAEATYGAMLDAIRSAESYVLVQFYIVRDDNSGRALRKALIERAKAGVRCVFLYDEVGSIKLPAEFLAPMRDAGIEVSAFRTRQGIRNRFQINFRNHRKLLVVDGKTGFIGGHNLGDEYLKYRDTHLQIDGPAAQQMQLTIAKDWCWATRRILQLDLTPYVVEGHDVAVSIANTGPADLTPNCSVLFSTLIGAAKERVWITSPYFVPDEVLSRALQAAALRGVDVRILLPDEADQRLVELASFTYYDDMTSCGVKLYRYRNRFMHHKVILIDDALSGVGTVNMDNRSLYLNFEETALVADRDFARKIEAMLVEDFASSDDVHCTHFDERSAPFRIAAQLARLTSPIL